MNATAVANLMQETTQTKPLRCFRGCHLLHDTRAAIISSDLRPALPRIWRPLSDLLARASYGLQSTTLELLAGSLVRYEDARSALEKLGAVGQDTGLKTQTWDQKRTT